LAVGTQIVDVASLNCSGPVIGEGDAELVKLDVGDKPPETTLWLVTYPDLRRMPAIKAVMAFLVDCVGREPQLK
jgi:hypothetical protein